MQGWRFVANTHELDVDVRMTEATSHTVSATESYWMEWMLSPGVGIVFSTVTLSGTDRSNTPNLILLSCDESGLDMWHAVGHCVDGQGEHRERAIEGHEEPLGAVIHGGRETLGVPHLPGLKQNSTGHSCTYFLRWRLITPNHTRGKG